jgi:hypothetical protein
LEFGGSELVEPHEKAKEPVSGEGVDVGSSNNQSGESSFGWTEEDSGSFGVVVNGDGRCCSTSELAAIGFASNATDDFASTDCSVDGCCCGASLKAWACGSGPAVVESPIAVVWSNGACALGNNAMRGRETWCGDGCGCGGAWGR